MNNNMYQYMKDKYEIFVEKCRDDTVSDVARHFAEWQKEQMMKCR